MFYVDQSVKLQYITEKFDVLILYKIFVIRKTKYCGLSISGLNLKGRSLLSKLTLTQSKCVQLLLVYIKFTPIIIGLIYIICHLYK